jgi:hypothetical protein
LLHVVDLDIAMPRAGLELRSEGLWADHVCEAPMEQWTVANECMAVALDDPEEAAGRAFGVQSPLALDLEWYASTAAEPIELGYQQTGEVEGIIDLVGQRLELSAPARRWHRWGVDAWGWNESVDDVHGERAPVRVDDVVLERTLTARGWTQQVRARGDDAAGTRSPPAAN